MQSSFRILLTAGLGAATMYYLDPSRGSRRRALARARFEDGRDSLTHGVQKATHGLDRATRRARVISRDASRRADRFMHGARTLSHDIGEHADEATHGARIFGREARDRAAGAAATLGSFIERNRPNGRLLPENGESRRLLTSPAAWLITVGAGAAAMYFLDPVQGLYRRTRFRDRVNRWRAKLAEGASETVRRAKDATGSDEKDANEEQPRTDNGYDRHLQGQGRPLPR